MNCIIQMVCYHQSIGKDTKKWCLSLSFIRCFFLNPCPTLVEIILTCLFIGRWLTLRTWRRGLCPPCWSICLYRTQCSSWQRLRTSKPRSLFYSVLSYRKFTPKLTRCLDNYRWFSSIYFKSIYLNTSGDLKLFMNWFVTTTTSLCFYLTYCTHVFDCCRLWPSWSSAGTMRWWIIRRKTPHYPHSSQISNNKRYH